MKVLVYGIRSDDWTFLESANQVEHELVFTEVRLEEPTVVLAKDFPAICCFVSDDLNSKVLEQLNDGGTKLIILSATSFNNLYLEAASRLGIMLTRVSRYSPYTVAEFAVGMVPTMNRNQHRAHQRVPDGNSRLEGLHEFDLHDKTNDQRLLAQFHRDLRRARSTALSIIPICTGAARAVTLVIPELAGKIYGIALRVPTPTVSIHDFVADLNKKVTEKEVNEAFKEAASGPLRGVLEYCEEPLASVDFKGNPASSIVDAENTMVIDGSMVKVLAWYDNEWGYSNRVIDLIPLMGGKGP